MDPVFLPGDLRTRIVDLMKYHKISQADLAVKIGVTESMERFCYARGGKISGGWTQNYGYIVETEHYRYFLRCNPSPGDYNGYLTAYDLDVQRQNMAQKEVPHMEIGGMI